MLPVLNIDAKFYIPKLSQTGIEIGSGDAFKKNEYNRTLSANLGI